jgi:hypothetical protein
MQTVHVVRDAGRMGVSATPPLDEGQAVEADWTVPNLAALVRLLGIEASAGS